MLIFISMIFAADRALNSWKKDYNKTNANDKLIWSKSDIKKIKLGNTWGSSGVSVNGLNVTKYLKN